MIFYLHHEFFRLLGLKGHWQVQRLIRLKLFVSQSSLDLWLELLHLIYAGSCLLWNVQQLFEFCLIYQYHLACTDPIQDKSIPKVTDLLKK